MNNLQHGLSGYVPVRNAIELDYCWRESILSLLPIVDEMVVCDCDSTDGTREAIDEWAAREPKMRVINWPWVPAHSDPWWYNNWLNFIRGHLRYDMQIMLDADEVLDPIGYPAVKRAADAMETRFFHYVFFWWDAHRRSPWGDNRKAVLAPTTTYMFSHHMVPPGERYIRDDAEPYGMDPAMIIYHYSAMRKRAAFYKKCRIVGAILAGGSTETTEHEKQQADPKFIHPDRIENSTPFTGKHPELMHKWLEERGWKL